MVNQRNWQLLQLFSGESASGEGGGAAAGERAADAGQQRLRELGVPEEKIRRHRARQEVSLPEGAVSTEGQAAADTDAQNRLTWEQILKDPQYNAQLQKIIRSRVKEEGKNKAILDILDPALRQLAKQHGLDPENLDHAALAEAITGQNQPQETPQQRFIGHIRKLQQQEQAFKAIVPDFDLRQELRNPLFARLTAPGVGLSVEDAFYAVHRRSMQEQSMQAAAQQASRMISNAIASGSRRPEESGTAAQAPSVSRFDYRNATPEQRKALKDAIRKAAAEGRKIYPG
jgi:hypothetical protein